jgi:hypothetical protein
VVEMFNIIVMPSCGVPFQKKLSIDLVEKTKQQYILPILIECMSTTTSFDLWMSKRAHDFFALIVQFLRLDWMPKHVTIRLFETIETS